MRASIIGAGLVVAVVAFVVARQRAQGDAGQVEEFGGDGWSDGDSYEEAGGSSWVESLGETVVSAAQSVRASVLGYSPDVVPTQYRAAIAQAEAANGIPAGLLARLLWQESRFRPDIIDGRTRSPVGAVGIAQFMPATAAEWGVNPLDPLQSIDGAGRYLAWLRRRVNTWAEALAAYNWGIGNVQRKGLAAAPLETRNYYSQILSDVGLA